MQGRSILMMLMFVYYGSMGFIVPYLPLLLHQTLPEEQIGFVLAAGPLVMLFMQPLWGVLSDKVGMKIILRVALIGTAVALKNDE